MKKVFALLLSVMMLMFMTGCVAEEPTELGLSAPWITFEKEMEVLFDQDPQVQIVFDQEKMELQVYVMKDQEKAAALDALLPDTKEFGNITLKITVIPPNPTGISNAELFEKAFKGNPALSFIHVAESPFGNFTYIVFQNKVVQFFNDNVGKRTIGIILTVIVHIEVIVVVR